MATTPTASASALHPRSTTCSTRSRATSMRSRATALLTGLALGYAPEGAPDFGLERSKLAGAAGEALRDSAARDRAAGEGMAAAHGSRSGGRCEARGSRSCCRGATRPSGLRSNAHCRRARRRARVPGAAAARRDGAADRRRVVRGRRRYRPAASRRRARRAAGGDLRRQRARPHRPGRGAGRSPCVGGKGRCLRSSEVVGALERAAAGLGT